MRNVELFGLSFANSNMEDSVKLVERSLTQKRKGYFAFLNAYVIATASQNAGFKRACKHALHSFADGMSVVFASRILGKPLSSRICGMDYFFELCGLAEKNGYSVFFLGADNATLEKAITHIKKKFPLLSIAGWRHGFFGSDNDMIDAINKVKPDLLFLGMGTPNDLLWIHEHIDLLNIKIALPFGNAFKIAAGTYARPPQWIQKTGLEWFYRFLREPRRLWKRYTIGNLIFLWLVFAESLTLIASRIRHGEDG